MSELQWNNAQLERYSRQIRFPPIGENGQRKLAESRVVIIGCGALGSGGAALLARAGVGHLRIVDRDYLELSNLHRQVLFEEEDALRRLPKAVAAVNRIRKINSEIRAEAEVTDLTPRNVLALIEGADAVFDGTDNMETRFLLNDACLMRRIPWVYGGAVGSTGMTMTIIPGKTPCFRCVFEELPPPGTLPTCDTVGVLNSVASLVAALEATEVLKLLLDDQNVNRSLLHVDVWESQCKKIGIQKRPNCPACAGRYEFLSADATSWVARLCGRNAVQITPPRERALDLTMLQESLRAAGEVIYNGFLLSLKVEGMELVIFPQGRVIVKGTTDESLARALYAKYIGL